MSDAIQCRQAVPILRVFDIPKADEFYLGFLGFRGDRDHRFDDNSPLYRQISRDGLLSH
jgi:catechol 2,3-dioxygenase-like lactoylglutathione lyase family enzyme